MRDRLSGGRGRGRRLRRPRGSDESAGNARSGPRGDGCGDGAAGTRFKAPDPPVWLWGRTHLPGRDVLCAADTGDIPDAGGDPGLPPAPFSRKYPLTKVTKANVSTP